VIDGKEVEVVRNAAAAAVAGFLYFHWVQEGKSVFQSQF
jgi:hypothetical protein